MKMIKKTNLLLPFLLLSLLAASCGKDREEWTSVVTPDADEERKNTAEDSAGHNVELKITAFARPAQGRGEGEEHPLAPEHRVSLFLLSRPDSVLDTLACRIGAEEYVPIRMPRGGGRFSVSGCHPSVETDRPEAFRWNTDVHKDVELLIAAPVEIVEGAKTAGISLKPVLHRLTVHVRTGEQGGRKVDLSQAEVVLAGVSPVAVVDLTRGKALAAEGDAVRWTGKGDSVVFLLPGQPLSGLKLYVRLEGKDYAFDPSELRDAVTAESLTAFAPGGQTTVTLPVNIEADKPQDPAPQPEESDLKNRTLCVCGTRIPPVTDPQWKVIPGTGSMLGLPWTEGCGWYDCNKLEPAVGGVDSEMCWAAGVANLLHWWMERHKAYIDRFHPDVPRAYKSDKESEIFDLYRKTTPLFGNKRSGVSPVYAANWFLNGVGIRDADRGGRYFKDVLGNERIFEMRGIYADSFTKDLADALKRNKGVAFTIKGARVHYYHELTLWGAEFDEEGRAAYIYVAENNDVDSGALLLRKALRYEGNRVYMEGSRSGDLSGFYLYELQTLDLGTEYWETKYGKLP